MALTNEFIQAVQSGNLIRVRIMLKDSLLVDPSATQFTEMEHYATSKIEHLYSEHDGEVLNFDSTTWNEDYLNQQLVTAINCFSKERIDLLKRMVQHLYKDKIQKMSSDTEHRHTSSKKAFTQKQAGIGITATGAVVTIAGVCTAQTLLTVGGVVVAAIGISLIIHNRGDA